MLYGFSHRMASASVGRRSSLVKCSKIKKYCKDCYMNAFNKPWFISIPHQQSLVAHAAIVIASNGVCTKRNTARFELLLFENEGNNNSQTKPA